MGVVGLSGAGKDTLLELAREKRLGDQRSVLVRRVIIRPGGEDHEPSSDEAFADDQRGACGVDL